MPQTTLPRRQGALPGDPLLYVLFPLVIAVAGGLVALLLLPAALSLGSGVEHANQRLASLGEAFKRIPRFPERSTIFANDGTTVLAQVYLDENREIVHLDEVSQLAREAVLAAEDDGFYQHGALNVPSVIRAIAANIAAGDVVQGGSTITQQLAKNAILSDPTQTFSRKWEELALAMRLEQRYTKDQILELYLNEVYMGNGVYGIGTAAEYYFGKPASDLTLAEGATLAAMIRAPEDYNPIDRPKRAFTRRNFVLDRMVALGEAPAQKVAKIETKQVNIPKEAGRLAHDRPPFFVTFITQQILANPDGEFDALGETVKSRRRTLFQGGLTITTTLDPDWQSAAEQAANQPYAVAPANPGYRQRPDTAIVSVDTADGAVRTMLSGRNFSKDQLNLATSTRQPGSAFKPFTLVAAFEQGIPPGQVYDSKSPFCSPAWTSQDHCVSNAEPGGGGFQNLTTATAHSTNVVFAQLALDVGPQNIVEAAHAMGITSDLPVVPSITLGTGDVSPLEMASAYQTLANGGKHCEPFAVARIQDTNGLLYRHKNHCKQVIDPKIAAQVTSMLQGVVSGGTGTAAAIGRPVAGKTGTTQEYSNAWFVGYTPQVATAVWVGFPGTPDPLDRYFGREVFGGTLAAPIWRTYMSRVVAGMPVESFPAPPAPATGEVPRVVGRGVIAAQKILADANFSSRVEEVKSVEPEGTVIGQDPRGGTVTQLGALVTLRVSTGVAPIVAVPDVVGKDVAAARATLVEAGFGVRVVEKATGDPKKVGTVLSQDPAGGADAHAASQVTLTVGVKKGSGG